MARRGVGKNEESYKIKGRMGVSHPSNVTINVFPGRSGELPLSFSFGERMVQKPMALTRSGLPSPSLDVKVRWCLYGYLLSTVDIILPNSWTHIKNTIRFL